jgi:hypothetical protein
MHTAAYQYIHEQFNKFNKPETNNWNVLEIGSLNINGSARDIIQPYSSRYVGIDVQAGPGVDLVASGDEFYAPEEFDIVVCAEVFEHTPAWKDIIKQAYINLKVGGIFIATMAGVGRPSHSGVDGGWTLHPGEHYENIDANDLNKALWMFSRDKEVSIKGTDTRCIACK